ncbi:MAG: acyltransferase [Actinobacteria bacterium]|nr:acyltransferase [Actinomycetota bacterium]
MGSHRKSGSWARSERNLPAHVVGLDGVRGVAVLLVFISHFHWILSPDPFLTKVTPWHFINRTFEAGFMGVDIFFVLSGFLITSLLMKDRSTNQKNLFKRFYRRRALRLLPALYALLIADFFVSRWENFPGDIQWRTTWHAILFLNNWNIVNNFGEAQNDLGHLWSLGIEEQFYLIWPLTIWLLAKLKIPSKMMIPLILFASLVVMVHRTSLWNDGTSWIILYIRTDTRLDSLLIGAMFAYVYRHFQVPSKILNSVATFSLMGLIYIKYVLDKSPFIFEMGWTIIALLAGFIILSVAEGVFFVQKVFTWRPLTMIGKVSYGLYLWHMPIFLLFGRHVTSGPKPLRLLIGIILASVVTSLSWFFIEKPFLNLKNRRYGNVPVIH